MPADQWVQIRATEDEKVEWWKKARVDGLSLSDWIRNRLNDGAEPRVAEAVKPLRGARPSGNKARVEVSRPDTAPDSASPPTAPTNPKTCSRCGHPRHKHGGFSNSCQNDTCHCERFQ